MSAPKPQVTTCHWLGSIRDPNTPYHYPSSRNFCYGKKTDYPPNKDTQARLCLVAEHVKCPLYVEPALRPDQHTLINSWSRP